VQTHPLVIYTLLSQRQMRGDRFPQLVEQQGIFEHPLREQTFGEAWQKHHPELASAGFLYRSDENASPTLRGRFAPQESEALAQD
jgi:hypothetical protein